MTDRPDLTVQQSDALWDAVAIPGPEQPAFVTQHERVCKTVAEMLHLATAPRGEHRVDAALAAFHEGEEPVTDPAVQYTPGQWIWQWNRTTPAERLKVAERVIGHAAQAGTCWEMRHEQRLEEDRKAWVIVARVRDVVNEMDGITGARHWARILRSALDGPGPAATEATQLETAARVFAGLHKSAEQDVSRVIALYEQWVKAGPPPLGVSLARWWDQRLIELHNAIQPPADQTKES